MRLVRVDLIGYIESEERFARARRASHPHRGDGLKRFHYRKPGLWVLVARVWRREPGLLITVSPEHAGCKTWVKWKRPLSTSGLSRL